MINGKIVMIIVNEDIQLKPIVLDLSMNIFNLIEKNRKYLSKTLAFIKYIKTVDDEINFIKSRNKNLIETFLIFYNNNIVGMIDDAPDKQKTRMYYRSLYFRPKVSACKPPVRICCLP